MLITFSISSAGLDYLRLAAGRIPAASSQENDDDLPADAMKWSSIRIAVAPIVEMEISDINNGNRAIFVTGKFA